MFEELNTNEMQEINAGGPGLEIALVVTLVGLVGCSNSHE